MNAAQARGHLQKHATRVDLMDRQHIHDTDKEDESIQALEWESSWQRKAQDGQRGRRASERAHAAGQTAALEAASVVADQAILKWKDANKAAAAAAHGARVRVRAPGAGAASTGLGEVGQVKAAVAGGVGRRFFSGTACRRLPLLPPPRPRRWPPGVVRRATAGSLGPKRRPPRT